MSRKKQPTIAEARSLREQMEGHICDLVIQFEDMTGMTVTRIDVSRERKPGFGSKETMDVTIHTKL